MTDHKGGLAKKLAEVTAALGWVEKRGTNQAQGYKYAQAVDIFDAVRTELSARNVSFNLSQDDISVHYPESGGQHVTVKGSYTFTDGESGEVVMGHWTGFDVDRAGKALWKAITGGLKYVFITTFLLPTGDDPENDSGDKAAAKPRENASATRTSSAPIPPKAEKVASGLTDSQRNKLMARLNDAGLGSPGQRKAFLLQLLQKQSTKQMTSADLDRALAELDDERSQVVDNARAVA